MCKHMLQQQYM